MCAKGSSPTPVNLSEIQKEFVGALVRNQDNLYLQYLALTQPPPAPPRAKPPPDTKHLLDMEERTAEPPGVTVPDLDL